MEIPQRVIRRRVSNDGHRHGHFVFHMTIGRALIIHIRVRDAAVDFLAHILISDLRLLMRLGTAVVVLLVHCFSLARNFFPRPNTLRVHEKLNRRARKDWPTFLNPRRGFLRLTKALFGLLECYFGFFALMMMVCLRWGWMTRQSQWCGPRRKRLDLVRTLSGLTHFARPSLAQLPAEKFCRAVSSRKSQQIKKAKLTKKGSWNFTEAIFSVVPFARWISQSMRADFKGHWTSFCLATKRALPSSVIGLCGFARKLFSTVQTCTWLKAFAFGLCGGATRYRDVPGQWIYDPEEMWATLMRKLQLSSL